MRGSACAQRCYKARRGSQYVLISCERRSFNVITKAVRVADEDTTGRGKRKRKGKNATTEDSGVDKGADGRAGPKSENVVLQKSTYFPPIAV